MSASPPLSARLAATLAAASLAGAFAGARLASLAAPPLPPEARAGAQARLARAALDLASPPAPPVAPISSALASSGPRPPGEAGGASCVPHEAQGFLKREAYVRGKVLDVRAHRRALAWRARRYGHVGTEETAAYNAEPATRRIVRASFLGRGVEVHASILPALRCVEAEIRRGCGASPYVPEVLHGHRARNTFRGKEVTNHLFGIAVDVDPEKNPCCGCVAPWPSHPACKVEAASAYERSALPRCFVEAFERFGFHWLGKDALVDTMHFEYLGDPRALAPRRAPSPERPGSTRKARSAKAPG